MDTLRNQLRSATAAQHERVDAAFSAYRLDQPEGYRAFLQAHAQVLIPLEIELEQAGIETMLDDWPLRCRRQALLADLKALGCAEPPLTPAGMAPSPGWSWGAAYVIEGSRLGGRVLARRVADANPSAPLRYLNHGSATPLWPSFLQKLEQQGSACDWSEVLTGANDTFERFLGAARSNRS
ncbi:MAG TPA: heme oxygenase [Pseudomonas sp.]|jgi:heme oxygenase|uniref:biliverdin-producing heme oxygenase n=1 Tax=Stutzerimonas xanthomarina TaxID=271420 RepID=UPI000E80E0D4|nr:biliverdin-producing heme oxygenase [Stutzerimonas xanthomarina]MBU0852844.1 biliverdin-producing heme oxygenase [Gammaproteobacteria bacterium]HAQ87314.1 heme oxygenase [Pseudomonas sp.]MBK3849606.1 heme oxygenase [Stutzerimonas xanthomarina]MBU1773903.1 biliverdin-producing heme oxygenase [Gammaproteobacteria bacterium]MBU2282489.1 biliverdin-producing heme oxygenase [Gammaproteobacteria bacterium]|tara:strand:+ start:3315 stop:3857 length:543 start_codon:yes stop_codon:yes gene_type:complete